MEMSYSPKMGYEAFLRNRKKENQAQTDNQTQQKKRTDNSQSNVLNRENLKRVSAQAQLYNSRLFQDAARLDKAAKQKKTEIEQKQQAAEKKRKEEQKAYDNMSLAEVDSRLEQLAKERAAF